MPKIVDQVEPEKCVPLWQSEDGVSQRLYCGNAVDVLKGLPSASVHCVVTSPPYWGLRAYATDGSPLEIGREQTPKEYVHALVTLFREIRRVLRDDGNVWLNLGDSYASGTVGRNDTERISGPVGTRIAPPTSKLYKGSALETVKESRSGLPSGNLVGIPWRVAIALQADGWILRSDMPWIKRSALPESVSNRPAKALEYIFMFCKRSGYFYDAEAVRQKSVSFYKPTDFIPDSAKDRAATAATAASRNNRSTEAVSNGRNFRNADLYFESIKPPHGLICVNDEMVGLDVTSAGGYSGSHYASYPVNLIKPLIKAGTSERGCCAVCGAPWERVVLRHASVLLKDAPKGQASHESRGGGNRGASSTVGGGRRIDGSTSTVGWQPSCECYGSFVKRKVIVEVPVSLEGSSNEIGDRDRSIASNRNGITGSLDGAERETTTEEREVNVYVSDLPLDDHPTIPCTVLDPFAGSGTTGLVCHQLGRRFVGIDLSREYILGHAAIRIAQAMGEKAWNDMPPGADGVV